MRYFGIRAVPPVPVLPDTVLTLLLTAGTAQAFDYPTGTDIIRITVGSTAAGPANAFFNPSSSAAQVASTGGTVTTASSNLNVVVPLGEARMYVRPRASTGFSLVSGSSLPVSVEFWSRAGTTG